MHAPALLCCVSEASGSLFHHVAHTKFQGLSICLTLWSSTPPQACCGRGFLRSFTCAYDVKAGACQSQTRPGLWLVFLIFFVFLLFRVCACGFYTESPAELPYSFPLVYNCRGVEVEMPANFGDPGLGNRDHDQIGLRSMAKRVTSCKNKAGWLHARLCPCAGWRIGRRALALSVAACRASGADSLPVLAP